MPDATIRPLFLALAVAMAPLVFRLPVWSVLWCAGWWGYLLLARRHEWPAPSTGVRRVVFAVAVKAPLADIPVQVVEPPGIGGKPGYRNRLFPVNPR